MILTVTLNPTIDRVLFVREFALRDLVRAEREAVSPSGKGIDVAAILHHLGASTLAIALNAGETGQWLAGMLRSQGVPCELIPAGGYTRVATLITELGTGRQSTLVAHTLSATADHLTQVLGVVERHVARSWGLVCAGSIPPGMPRESWATILAAAHRHGLTTLLDSSGDGLRLGLAARPDLLKVNGRELAELAPECDVAATTGDASEDSSAVPADLRRLAGLVQPRVGEWARQALVVTLGRRGALLATAEDAWYAPALTVPVVSPAGAGDAFTAGLLLARRQGRPWPAALSLGTACAAATVMDESTSACPRDRVESLLSRVALYAL
jgi:1-phosphofructokinase family hexose kinase